MLLVALQKLSFMYHFSWNDQWLMEVLALNKDLTLLELQEA